MVILSYAIIVVLLAYAFVRLVMRHRALDLTWFLLMVLGCLVWWMWLR